MVSKVFEILWRDEFDGYTLPYVNIRFFSKYMKENLRNANNCGVLAVKQILQLISAEQLPIDLINRVISIDRENEDVAEFHNTSVTNRMFSCLLAKNFICPRNHHRQELSTSVGLTLNGPKKMKQSLNALIKSYFAEKISTAQCK